MSKKGWLIVSALFVAAVVAAHLVHPLEHALMAMHGGPSGASHRSGPAETAAVRAKSETWPDTPAGRMGAEWVEAFGSGEEAMRKFLEKNLSARGRAERPVGTRVERYRDLYERFGVLTFALVEKSEPDELTAVLLAEDASRHRFVFTVETKPPHRLVKVGMIETRAGHGAGVGSHH